jgi:hypothetical protein
MKNLLDLALLAVLLGAAGCASDSPQPPGTDQTGAPRWQFRTFPITANNDFEFHSKVLALNQQGWTYVSMSHFAPGGVVMVMMKRPTQ